jgi:hypothetical protein
MATNLHSTTPQEDGSKFDSSRDRGTPFTFKLGQGKVIKGWDLGVATMKRGEKAMLTIRSDYGYDRMRALIHTRTHAHTNARARAHTHTHTHTHTHKHTHSLSCARVRALPPFCPGSTAVR